MSKSINQLYEVQNSDSIYKLYTFVELSTKVVGYLTPKCGLPLVE